MMTKTNLPRRTFLTTTSLALLAPLVQTEAHATPGGTRAFVKVTIAGTGAAFRKVTAHFRLPDGTSVPFYAWDVQASTVTFTMPLTNEGLRLTVEGDQLQELTLRGSRVIGTHVLTQAGDPSKLRITVKAA